MVGKDSVKGDGKRGKVKAPTRTRVWKKKRGTLRVGAKEEGSPLRTIPEGEKNKRKVKRT